MTVRLFMTNIGIFVQKHILIPSQFVVIREHTARGKTTIAKVLHAFLSGVVDQGLLRYGASRGEAELEINGKKYKLVISDKETRVDRVLNAEYAKYLVITEGAPLFEQVFKNLKLDIDRIAAELIPMPREVTEFRKTSRTVDYDELLEMTKDEIAKTEIELKKKEEELKKIEEQIKKASGVEKVASLISTRNQLEDEVKALKEEIDKLQKEKADILSKLKAVDTEALRRQVEEVRSRLGSVRGKETTVRRVIDALVAIKSRLEELDNYGDILAEINKPLFGQLYYQGMGAHLAEETAEFISELEAILSAYKSERINLEDRLARLEQKLSEASHLWYRNMEIDTEISKLSRRLREVSIRLISVKRDLKNELARIGMSEAEVVANLRSSGVYRLMAVKNRVEKEIEELKNKIDDLKAALRRIKEEKERYEEKIKEEEEKAARIEKIREEVLEKRRMFKQAFQYALDDAFSNISIPHYDHKNGKPMRSPSTYSDGERLYIVVAHLYALAYAIEALGQATPLVVIDLVYPMDSKYVSEIIRLFRKIKGYRIMLMTSDRTGVESIT